MPRSSSLGVGAEVAEIVGDFGVGVLGAFAIFQVVQRYFNILTARWVHQTDENQSFPRKNLEKAYDLVRS